MALRLILGDFLSVSAIGGLTGLLCAWAVNPSWGMVVAMFEGMLLGMALGFVWSPIVGIWLGAHEAMIPAMLTGMIAGMVVAMRSTAGPLSLADAASLGGAIGCVCLLFTYAMNAMLRGEKQINGEAR